MRSPVSGGTTRDLLVVLGAITSVALAGVVGMALVADGAVADPVVLALLGAGIAAFGIPGAVRHRRTAHRRRLRRLVGDPVALRGTWRRSLAAAWEARDRYAAAVAAEGPSPLSDRLADQQAVIDAALQRCGVLARDGDLLERQLRGFGVRRLRRDLRVARRRDPAGPRVQQLEARLHEVDRLAACIRETDARLEAQVHELRTAAWRATELRVRPAIDADAELTDLVAGLAHLRDALDEVDAPPHQVSGVDTNHRMRGSTASAGGRRYDV